MKLFKITRIYGCEYRGDGDKLYLLRITLIECKYFKLCIHIFYRSDADDFHDHPWNFWTFPIWRGYKEEVQVLRAGFNGNDFNIGEISVNVLKTTSNIKPFNLYYRKATHTHRVVLHDESKKAITIVLMTKYIRQWGFWTKHGWIKWTEYFKQNRC